MQMQDFSSEEEVICCLQSSSVPLDVKLKAATKCLGSSIHASPKISGRAAGSIFQFACNLLIRSADFFIKNQKLLKQAKGSEVVAIDPLASAKDNAKSSPAFLNATLWQLVNQLLQMDITEISVGVSTISIHFLKPIFCLCLHLLGASDSKDNQEVSALLLQVLRTLRTKHCELAGGSWQPPILQQASIMGKLVRRYAEVGRADARCEGT
jgi:hypothetical protein